MRMHTWVYTHMCVFSLAVDYRSNGDGGARVSELLRLAGLYIYACMNICVYDYEFDCAIGERVIEQL